MHAFEGVNLRGAGERQEETGIFERVFDGSSTPATVIRCKKLSFCSPVGLYVTNHIKP